MSRSNWLKHPQARLVGGLIVAIFAGGVILGYGHSESAEYERQANAKRSEYARYTSEKVTKTCLGLVGAERAGCFYDAANAQAEYEYNQADLIAQRQSALWGYIMAFAAVIGMVLSAVGVWLVWTTFRATKEANEISQTAFDYQFRPWIKLEPSFGRLVFENNSDLRVKGYIKCENMGQFPATGVSISATFLEREWTSPRIINGMGSFFFGASDVNWHDRSLFHGDVWNREVQIEAKNIVENWDGACIAVVVRYKSVSNFRDYHYTCCIYDLVDRDTGSTFIDFNASSRIKIVQRENFPSYVQ